MRKIAKIGIFVGMVLVILQIGALPLTLPEAVKLEKDVQEAPYCITDYEKGEFDCSNMAALLSDYLEFKGWNTTIVRAPDRHAWIKVNDKLVEPTSKRIFFAGLTYNFRYPDTIKYNDSREVRQHCSEIWNCSIAEREYGYQEYLIEHSGKEFENLSGYG